MEVVGAAESMADPRGADTIAEARTDEYLVMEELLSWLCEFGLATCEDAGSLDVLDSASAAVASSS